MVVIADMGIAPTCTRDGTRLVAAYGMPALHITQFDPTTGQVRFKVTPAAGNQIASEIATGYIHVFGTDNLGERMHIPHFAGCFFVRKSVARRFPKKDFRFSSPCASSIGRGRECGMVPPPSTTKHKETEMKLTKTDIRQKRAELVDVLLKIEKLKDDKTSLEKTLSADFEQNEAAYRNGIATENGILIRRPSWKSVAKPVVEAA